MASETATPTDDRTATPLAPWQAGTIAGIAGAIAMGALMTMQMPGVVENAIPALYGLAGGAAGFAIHVAHGAVLGVVFAAVLVASGRSPSVPAAAGAGLVYGVVVWVLLAALVMPVWLSTVGFPMAPPVPNFDPTSLVGHAVYGLVLGIGYAVLE
ncbi:histidine kinase [Saliphagus sp. LR7]|uniref:histidine kinase n=1 Tax=Saliphagus sp. LR7 TaxID=2282654 RepID=UPI000DF73776|nr:histidine kinase [Saliphagus sp. LR7]